jgi:hypothetical protein
MTILLLHRRGSGWRASQFNARTSLPTWSAFRRPGFSRLSLELGATCGAPAVRLQLARTGHPCTSQTAPVCAGQHFRWQSEPGILARGQWRYDDDVLEDVAAVGYHERVRGRWSWPALGGWVFGFINETASAADGPPGTALVFTLIQPREMRHVSGSVMLWRNGRLKRHFPRRRVSVAVCGELDRSRVACVPPLAELFGVAPTAPVPQRLVVTAALGEDHALLDFEAESAARIVIPSESGLLPFSVHEVYGPCRLEGRVNGAAFACDSFGIVEFAGGACED